MPQELTARQRYAVLTAAFLGWMFCGLPMSVVSLAANSATEEFYRTGYIDPAIKWQWGQLWSPQPVFSPGDASASKVHLQQARPRWFAWYNASFLIGAACGGLGFGWLGDRAGRVRAMALSILTYSLFSGAGYVARSPEQFLVLRFIAALGIGGMWPNGVALASEAWPDASRPTLAGLIGTAVNVGNLLMGALGYVYQITPDSWRWVNLTCLAPAVIGLWAWWCVPESRVWLATRLQSGGGPQRATLTEVFTPPLLRLTLLGIALGTIPVFGGWGVTQWTIPWAEQVGGKLDPNSKALTAMMRAGGGAIGSLLGGWLANQCGRRTTYFVVSLLSLVSAEILYGLMHPSLPGFQAGVFVLGFISTIFFGWLPLYLPELFPTRARATGSGISFNFGRIISALGVLGTGSLTAFFHENYSRAGVVMSLVYALGMVVILFAPDTSQKKLGGS